MGSVSFDTIIKNIVRNDQAEVNPQTKFSPQQISEDIDKICDFVWRLYAEQFDHSDERSIATQIRLTENQTQAESIFGKRLLFAVVGMEASDNHTKPYKRQLLTVFQKMKALKEKGVEFDEEHPNYRYSSGQVDDELCSAMALTTLKYVLENSSKRPNAKKLIKAAGKFKDGVSQEIALAQIVFNTLVCKKGDQKGDSRFAKMQTMANLFDLKLQPFPTISTDAKKTDFVKELEAQIDDLPEGIYLIHLIGQEEGGSKMSQGEHSLVFLKERERSYLFDPGMAMVSMITKETAAILAKDLDRWGSSKLKFYVVELKP